MSKISATKNRDFNPVRIKGFNPINYLNDENDISAYFETVKKEGNIDLIKEALNHIARARLFIDLSKKTGISLDQLRSSLLRSGKPDGKTIEKIARTFEISNQPKPANNQQKPANNKPKPVTLKV